MVDGASVLPEKKEVQTAEDELGMTTEKPDQDDMKTY